MNEDTRVEFLAQSLWMEHFNFQRIDPRWITFAATFPDQANELRTKAQAMIEAARPYGQRSSLGALFQ